MVPNPQGQQRRLESINSLFSQPIQASEPLELPPILSTQPPESVSVQPPPTSRSPTTPIPELAPSPPPAPSKEWLSIDWNKAKVKSDTHIINTSFSPDINKGVPYNTSEEDSRWAYTQRLRKSTLGATPAHSIEELRTLLVDQLADGKRQNRDCWIEMSSEILNGYVSYCFTTVF